MTGFADDDLTRNDFLGGRLRLWQPKGGYRAGVDPVLLAAAVPAKPGQSVLELGCGAGAAILCLAVRVGGLQLAGVELQPNYADLAERNATDNDVDLQVFRADLTDLPDTLKQRQFNHVMANPPYYRAGAHSPAADVGRKTALSEATGLDGWIDTAARRLSHRGYLHVIQKADRTADLLHACEGRLGSLELLPLAPRHGRAAELVILRARKGGKAAFRLHAPLILHSGTRHKRDGEDYAPDVQAVLREGKALPWPGRG